MHWLSFVELWIALLFKLSAIAFPAYFTATLKFAMLCSLPMGKL